MRHYSPNLKLAILVLCIIFSIDSFSQCDLATTITTYPHTESFESNTSGLWYQDTVDDTGNWSYNTGTTLSNNTGPNGASDGNVYFYTEASTNPVNGNVVGANGTAFLDSPCLDLTGLTVPTLTFDYHMAGANMGDLKVQISTDDGATWADTGWFRNGAQQAYNTPWLSGNITFIPNIGQTIRLRFHATTGNGWSSDIAIDNINFFNASPQPEIEVTGLGNTIVDGDTTPNVLDDTDFGAFYIPGDPVVKTFTIENNGTQPLLLDGVPLVSITGPDAGDFTVTANPTTPIPGATSTTFSISFSTATAGLKNATVTIENNDSDEDPYSFSIAGTGVVPPPCVTTVSVFPYGESFETGIGLWTQATGDDGDWTREGAGIGAPGTDTPSADTGPLSAHDGDIYIFTEASGGGLGANAEAFLDSPCFDLTGFTTPLFSFNYHMAGASMGTLKVQISTNNALTWEDTGWTRTGSQHTSADPWIDGEIDLSAYVGRTIRLRFHGTTGPGFESDMAVDNINFIDDIPRPEINVVGLGNSILDGDTTPAITDNTDFDTYNLPFSTIEHTFVIENNGLLPLNLTGAPMVSITGPNAGDFSVNTLPTSPIAPGGFTTFTITFSTATTGVKNATVTIDSNDSFISSYDFAITGFGLVPPVCNATINTYPYSESFETGFGNWIQGPGDDIDWTREGAGIGNPGTGTLSIETGPDAAADGDIYVYTEASGNPLDDAFLDSPCFDLTGLINPEFNFSYHMYGASSGSIKILISTNNGFSFNDFGWFQYTEVQTAHTSPWFPVTLDLSGYLNQTVKIRIFGQTGNGFRSDIAIDDISLRDPVLANGPGGVTNSLRTWLKATDGLSYTSGQDVSLWSDQGNGGDATVHTAGQEPTYYDDPVYNINFNPVVNFENVDGAPFDPDPTSLPQQYLVGDSGFYTHDMFVVAFPDDTVNSTFGYMDMFSGDSNPASANINDADFTGLGWGDYYVPISNEVIACTLLNNETGGYYGTAQTSTSVSYTNGGILNTYNNQSNTGRQLDFNGIDIVNTVVGVADFLSLHDTKFWLGRSKGFTGSYQGKIAEVITYSYRKEDLFATQERNRIQSYLAIKYGITLGTNGTSQDYVDSDGTVIWDQSVNTGFNYNITGIGRDDASELNQKQSLSTNNGVDGLGPTEAILTIGLSDIYDTNNLNPNLLGDKQFLVWGDNNGNLNLSNTFNYDLSSGIGGLSTPVEFESTQRIWKVVENGGDIGTVKLSIPMNAVRGVTPPGDYYMFISDTGVFTANDEYRLMTQVGTGATATLETTFDFDNTKYITFGYAEETTEVRSVYFDGTNDLLEMEDNLNLDPTGFTISAWIKRDAGTNNASIVSKRNTANTNGYDLRLNGLSHLEMRWVNGGNRIVTSSVSIPQDEWHHVAVTYDGTNAKLFIDGVLDTNANLPAPLVTTEFFNIAGAGTTSYTDHFGGNIDEVRVWNTDLTTDQLRYVMNQEIEDNTGMADGVVLPTAISKNDINAIPWTQLAGYYPMTRYTYTNTKDESGNDITGALRNLNTVDFQTAPLPYESDAGGAWNTGATWLNNTEQTLPNALSIVDGTTPINWNIVRINHNVNINTDAVLGRQRSLLGLMVDSNTLSVDGVTASGTGNGLTVTHYLSVDGKLDLNGESQLIQTTDSDLDVTSSGTLERDQQGTRDLFTYNYWSAPVGISNATSNNNGYTVPDIFFDGTNPASPMNINFLNSGFNGTSGSPIGIADYWIWKFNNRAGDDYSEWQHVRSTGSLIAGEGFTLKGVNNTGGMISTEQNYVIEGKPNNSDIALAITSGNDYLIGNPYPSAIDAIQFLTDNGPTTTGTLYFWEHWGGGSHNLLDYQGGYATYNLSGGAPAIGNDPDVGTGGTPTKTPGQYIPVAQGFFVTGGVSGNVEFNNGQRVYVKEGASSIFIRNGDKSLNNRVDEEENDDTRTKIRLGLSSVNGLQRQLLITQDIRATSGIDWGYDGQTNEEQMDDMYWMIENEKFIIQGIDVINEDTVLPIGIHTRDSGNNTFKIDALENVPTDLNIYLLDKEKEVYYDLRTGNYTVHLEAGENLTRFELVFKNEDLSVPEEEDFDTDIALNFYNADSSIEIINPQLEALENIEIINIIGQSIFNFETIETKEHIEMKLQPISVGVYTIKLKTENGTISKKIIID